MSFIEIRNVWQRYGDQVVLEQLNLRIAEGEFCTLVGASGCGKSTFLRLLLGQERPSKGELRLEGRPLPAEPDAQRGVVFQRYSVFPHLNVLDNVAVGLELRAAPLLGRLLGQRKRRARGRSGNAPPGRSRPRAGALPQPALGRHAATPGHRPGAHHPAAHAAARRALRRAGPRHTQGHARAAARALARGPADGLHGDPRSVGGIPSRHATTGVRQGAHRSPGAAGAPASPTTSRSTRTARRAPRPWPRCRPRRRARPAPTHTSTPREHHEHRQPFH